jgi:S-adenosyl methyltransferase
VTSSSSSSLGIDTTVPSTARMYDFWLGGHDNFAADRAAALKVSEVAPEAQLMAVENRGFLRRAVRYLAADAGIRQFLDIGHRAAHAGQRAPGRPGHQPCREGRVCRQ